MADPAALPARPPGPGPAFPAAAGTRTGVPLSIWPAVPAPVRCPAGAEPTPCPRRLAPRAALKVITGFSRPGDLVVIPDAGTGALIVAAAAAARRVLGLTASAGHQRDLSARLDRDLDPALRALTRLRHGGPRQLLHAASGETGQAALAVTAACATPGCPPPAPAGDGDGDGGGPDTDPGLLYAACQRVLRPGGLLAVITSAARQPGHPGELIACARAAGLIYTQHIIALHAPIRGSRLTIPAADALSLRPDTAAAAPVNLPIHSDLLLFAAPGGPRHD